MYQKEQNVKAQAVPAVPYLRTMLNGLVHETNPKQKHKLYMGALDALTELAEMEQELLTIKLKGGNQS